MHRGLRCLLEGSRHNVLDFVQPQGRALILLPQLNRRRRLCDELSGKASRVADC
jgi:hypothetical protein